VAAVVAPAAVEEVAPADDGAPKKRAARKKDES
jgi:hypothetical protein